MLIVDSSNSVSKIYRRKHLLLTLMAPGWFLKFQGLQDEIGGSGSGPETSLVIGI